MLTKYCGCFIIIVIIIITVAIAILLTVIIKYLIFRKMFEASFV